jgi:hypothetical protein
MQDRMKQTFIETSEFTEWVKHYLADEALADLQRELQNDPDAGSVMPGCGGLRKIRAADSRRGKGKRGGIRVIYLHVADAAVIFLMDIYGKDEPADLTVDEKRVLTGLAERYKRAAIQAAGLFEKGKS